MCWHRNSATASRIIREAFEQFKGVRTHKRASRPFLTLAESSCIVIQRMPNKAFNTDGEYAAA
jgi:hypothetical protein